jgi:DNA-binding LytR/AlgR family response regulator
MKILIVEDESHSARKLKKLLEEIDPSIKIETCLESIEASVLWLKNHLQPDLIFMDIQLSDGISLEIFKQISINCPVIFTTAYDEYALQAFKVNSIDYLLKPIDKAELVKSLQKFDTLSHQNYRSFEQSTREILFNSLKRNSVQHKARFLIKSGQGWTTIVIDDIAYFLSDRKVTFLVTHAGKKYIMNEALDELERQLNPYEFFRLNRQFIASVKSIAVIQKFFNGKLKLQLKPASEQEVIVGREKAKAFKEWLNQ